MRADAKKGTVFEKTAKERLHIVITAKSGRSDRKAAVRVIEKHFSELSADELYALLKIRSDVFIVEQACAYPDLDDRDQDAVHVWIERNGNVEAYLRVMDRGAESEYVSIGRVVARERGCGFGRLVMEAGIRAAKKTFHAGSIYLEAQTYAVGFYRKLGFRIISDEFVQDGLPHVWMLRDPDGEGDEP